MKKHIYLTMFVFVFCCLTVTAQSGQGSSNSSKPNFFSIQKEFYENYNGEQEDVDEGEGVKDGSYEKFKRWEWYWQSRVDKDGNFPPADILVKELKAYKQSHNLQSLRSTSTQPWSFYGPSTSVGGYYGIGRVNCIAFHPTDANTFWVGTPAGGIWKTTNGGTSWTTTSDDFPVLGVGSIVVDPANPNIVYIGTGDGEYATTQSTGVLKSTDGGLTFNTTGLSWSAGDNKVIRKLIINPSSTNIIFAATTDGIYKTSDAGVTWINQQTGRFGDIEFKPGDATHVYASTYDYWGTNEVYTSTDGGDTWNVALTPGNGVSRISIAVSAASPNDVDALCADFSDRSLHSVWRSTNSGASFTQYLGGSCSNNYLSREYPLNGSTCDGQGDYDLAFAKNPTNASEIWIGGVNTWKSSNGGSVWSIKNFWYSGQGIPVAHADKHAIEYNPLNGKVYECSDGGLNVTSNNGTTWTNLSNGLGITQIYRISTSATIADDVICGTQDNSTKQLKNGSWLETLDSGDGIESIIDFTNPSIEYGMRVQGVLRKSTNGGSSWSSSGSPLVSDQGTGVNEAGEWLTPLVMNPSNHNELLIGKSQVYKSTNGGSNWSALGTISGITYGKICSMAYAPSNTQIIYAASRKEMYKTTNGGSTWTQLTVNPPLDILSIAVSSSDPQKIWLTQSHYASTDRVWQSSDGGNTWSDYSGTLPAIPVNCIVCQNGSNDALYIGTDLGVFYRDATMSDWVAFDNGLPNVIVNDLEISASNNKIWAGTFGRGLWRSDLSIGINELELSNSISVFPNPSPGLFTISSSLTSNNLEIQITNMIGEEVYKMKSQMSLTDIDLSKESNGIYFVKIITPKGSTTKKLVLNKQD